MLRKKIFFPSIGQFSVSLNTTPEIPTHPSCSLPLTPAFPKQSQKAAGPAGLGGRS